MWVIRRVILRSAKRDEGPRSFAWRTCGAQLRMTLGVLLGASCLLPAVVSADSVADLCRAGAGLYAKGNLPGAAAKFRQALAQDPRSDQAHVGLGVVLYAQQQTTDAILHFRTAIGLNPRNASAYVNLGSALVDQDRLTEAVQVCRTALRLNPNSAGAHYNLGRTYARQKQTKSALTEYNAALRLNPSLATAWLSLGTLHANVTKNHVEAVRCFRRYLQLVPNPPDCTCWIKAYLDRYGK